MAMIRHAYNTAAGLSIYIMDDGTWNGTGEDTARFPTVEVGFDADGNEDMSGAEIAATFKANEAFDDMKALGFAAEAAREAANALAAALAVVEYTPPGLLASTARVLGMTEVTKGEALSSTYKRAAATLEWEDAKWQTFGHLPTAGGWHDYGLPREIAKHHFVWRRVNTQGTGNGGQWVPAKCQSQTAKALFAWFRNQTSVPFYGGYWWEVIDAFGPAGLDEIAWHIAEARDRGVGYPNSCAAAARIDGRLGRLSGPRMWALVGAVAPYNTWHPERVRREGRLVKAAKINSRLPPGIKFIPA